MLQASKTILSWRRFFAAAALILVSAIASVHAEGRRVALVIGNGAYRNVPALPNPPRDASDMAAALERLGFSVTRVSDGDLAQTRKALAEFGQTTQEADIAIVFYAGHGIEASGENWLIPVDAQITSDSDTKTRAVSLHEIMTQLEKVHGLGLVILDACRDNPFEMRAVADAAPAQRGEGATKTRSISHGLAPANPSGNVLVAFSAKDGTVAQDGDGRNSPFTAALLRHIEQPGVEVTFLFRIVRDEVMQATNGAQQPFVYGSLSKESIYLKPPTSDQLLSTMPAIAPETRPSNALFSADDARLVGQIAQEKHFNMPTFQIDAIDDDVPAELKRFLGIWVSKVGNAKGSGRQTMIIVSHLDKEGTASGYYVYGPPTARAWNQSPASYHTFKTKISDERLQFQAGKNAFTLALGSDNRMSYHAQTASRFSDNMLYPLWHLTDSGAGRTVSADAGTADGATRSARSRRSH